MRWGDNQLSGRARRAVICSVLATHRRFMQIHSPFQKLAGDTTQFAGTSVGTCLGFLSHFHSAVRFRASHQKLAVVNELARPSGDAGFFVVGVGRQRPGLRPSTRRSTYAQSKFDAINRLYLARYIAQSLLPSGSRT